MPPAAVNLLDLGLYANGAPHMLFRRLRAEDPVHWHDESNGPGFWAVLRYDDVVHVSRRVDLFSSSLGGTMIPDAQEAELALLRLIATGSPAAPIERVGHRFDDQAHVDFNAGRDAALTG